MIAAALAGMAGGGTTARAQTGQETESTLARDLTVAQKPLYQLASGADTMDVEAWVDNPSLTYAIGQPLRVMVRPRQDAHITVVNVDADGRVAVLYPNHFQRETQVRAGAIVMIPHEGASWRFNVTGPVGIDLFKIFASRRPLSLPELDQLVRASEKSPLVTLGRSADTVARDLVAQLKPDTAGANQQAIGMRNILVRIVAEPPRRSARPLPPFTVQADRPVYRVGEKVQISVMAHRDCRLTLVSVGASGNAVQLFPNPVSARRSLDPDRSMDRDSRIRCPRWRSSRARRPASKASLRYAAMPQPRRGTAASSRRARPARHAAIIRARPRRERRRPGSRQAGKLLHLVSGRGMSRGVALHDAARYSDFTRSRKEGRAMMLLQHYHYRQRGPVDALQMRLQG